MNETNDRIVDIHDIPGSTMSAILDYAYSREIKLNEENIYQILPAANQLQVLDLFSLCEHFLYEKFNAENVLGIREFASFYCKWGGEGRVNEEVLFRLSSIASTSRELSSVG